MTLALAAVLLLAAQAARPYEEERLLLDRRLEALRRILPDGAPAAQDAALARELAEGVRLASVETAARPPVESGGVGHAILELSALGRYADVDRFFRQIALSPRLIDVESLSLSASPGDLVKLTTLLRFPYRPPRAPLPPPPQGVRAPAVARPQAEAFLRDESLALAKSEAIAGLRRTRRNPRLFLAELVAISRERPMTVTQASLGEEFQIRGLVLGEGPARELQARFESGFFRMSEFLMVRQGACRRYEARGKSPVAGPDAELPLPVDDPFDTDDAACRPDRDSGAGPTLRNDAGRKGAQGALTLRLRDMDLADVFHTLHLLTGQGFLVDGAVSGRASLDLSRVTLEEALSALRKSGLRIAESGTLRRVSPGSWKPAPETAGPPFDGGLQERRVSFALKRAELRDVLAVITDIESGYAALGPRGPFARASVFARDVPLHELRPALLAAAGLRERIEEDRRLLYRPEQPEEPAVAVARSGEESRLALATGDLVSSELELAGVASSGGAWIAFAYSPTGRLHAFRAGDRLADAVVKSVESTDATLDTDDGPLRLYLAPLGR
jgi:hypothetical protein